MNAPPKCFKWYALPSNGMKGIEIGYLWRHSWYNIFDAWNAFADCSIPTHLEKWNDRN